MKSKYVTVQMRHPWGEWHDQFYNMNREEAEDLVYGKNRLSPYDWRISPEDEEDV